MDILESFRSMKAIYNRINMALLAGQQGVVEGDLISLREKCKELNGMSDRFKFAVEGSDSELLKSIADVDNRYLER